MSDQQPSSDARPLFGGVSADVARVGDTVRRTPTPAAPTIHEFLHHLRARGFNRVPHPRGFDEDGREQFDFIDGRAGHPPITEDIASDEALVSAAETIRRFHDLSTGFTGAGWDTGGADPSGVAEVICHNDLAPFNLIYQDRTVAAIIDWDGAAPGRRAWDLAYAAWRLVPLHRPAYAELVGWPALDRSRRLALFVDAYGLDEQSRAELLPLIRERQLATIEGMRRLAQAGRITQLSPDDPRAEAGDLPYLEANAATWERAIRPPMRDGPVAVRAAATGTARQIERRVLASRCTSCPAPGKSSYIMTIRSHARALAVVLSLFLCAFLPSAGSEAAPPQEIRPAQLDPSMLLHRLAGTWNVRQRMWTGPASDPVPLPPATVHRRLVHGAYLDEDMTLAANADGEPFTRHAVLSYNAVKQTFEYFSIDTRLPQMMAYPSAVERGGKLSFTLPEPFVAPAWGDDTDVPFAARLQIQPGQDRQVVRLYLRRLSAQPTEEFIAFEYIYRRAG